MRTSYNNTRQLVPKEVYSVKKYWVVMTRQIGDYPEDTELYKYSDALRAIIEANYNYAFYKYGPNFDETIVTSYQCVILATEALESSGFNIIVTRLPE